MECETKYKKKDINIVATTQIEGLFDLRCNKCKSSTIVNVMLTPENQIGETKIQKSRKHKKISQNDVLDLKNFLAHFDGNFKKIFTNKK